MGDGFGSVDIGEAGVDEMGLSALFDFEDGPNKSLDHGFIVDEALFDFRLAFVFAVHDGF